MKKIQILRITNNIILALSLIGYFILWKDITKASRTIDKLGLADFATYINAYLIESLIISILIWLFISTFCENAEDTKEVLSLLKGREIQKKDITQGKKITNIIDKEEMIEIENLKRTTKHNELIVKVKKSGKIEKIKNDDWQEIVKLGNEDMFEIKYRKLFK